MGLTGRTAFRAPLKAMLAAIRAGAAALGDSDVAVVIGVETEEGGVRPRPGLSDHNRAAGLHAFGVTGAAGVSPVSASGARAALGAGFAARVELGLADDPVIVGVEPVETSVGAAGPTGFRGGATLIGGHRSVAVGVGDGQASEAAVDEFGLAEAVVAVRVAPQVTGLRGFRGLPGDGGAARGGEGQGREGAGQKGSFHLDGLHGRPSGRASLSGE